MAEHVDSIDIEGRVLEAVAQSDPGKLTKDERLARLVQAVTMVDLTTLEGSDTPEKVEKLCARAKDPAGDGSLPPVAAVCVYPALVRTAVEALRGSPVRVASVAGGFPHGQTPLEAKVAEVRFAAQEGADEIDVVFSRNLLLSGHEDLAEFEIAVMKEACGQAHLKVILETGELKDYDLIRRASLRAIRAGADFIKTSTGKTAENATLPVTLVMLDAIRDYYLRTGRRVGMKPAGGIRTSEQALQYLSLLERTLGPDWVSNELFRFGASSLLDALTYYIGSERDGVSLFH